MKILIILLAVASMITVIGTFIFLRKKLQYFRENFTYTEDAYKVITLPYRATNKAFILYSVALGMSSICFYEIFKHFLTQ